MAEKDLQRRVQDWQGGDRQAFWQVCTWLWETQVPAAFRFVLGRIYAASATRDRTAKAKDCVAEAFWAAMEELDLKVSHGVLLTTELTIKRVQRNGVEVRERVFKGKVTGRELSERDPFQWHGEEEFGALFYKILRKRCRDSWRREVHRRTVPVYKDDGQGGVEIDKELYPWKHIRIGLLPEEEFLDRSTPHETLFLARDTLLEFVEALAQVAAQLHYQNRQALARTVDYFILYVKWEIMRAGSPHAELNIQQLREQTIESLLETSEVSYLDFDEMEPWEFVRKRLNLTQNTLHQRKHLLCEQLRKLPGVPDILRKVMGSLWCRQMQHWVTDCHSEVARLTQEEQGDRVAMLWLVEVYLRWIFAQGHIAYRSRPLDWVQSVALKELFTVYNPALLVPAYPTASHFQQFARNQGTDGNRVAVVLVELRDTMKTRKPQPVRLIALMNALL